MCLRVKSDCVVAPIGSRTFLVDSSKDRREVILSGRCLTISRLVDSALGHTLTFSWLPTQQLRYGAPIRRDSLSFGYSLLCRHLVKRSGPFKGLAYGCRSIEILFGTAI